MNQGEYTFISEKEEWIVILEVAIEVLKELLSGLSDSTYWIPAGKTAEEEKIFNDRVWMALAVVIKALESKKSKGE